MVLGDEEENVQKSRRSLLGTKMTDSHFASGRMYVSRIIIMYQSNWIPRQ